jgi:hypothetical protein
MKKLFKILGTCSMGVMGVLSSGSSAMALTGATTVTVSVPAFLVLYYPTSLTINLYDASTATATATLTSDESPTDTFTTSALTVASTNVYGSKTVNIPNAFALRGITSGGSARVQIATNNTTLTESTNNSPSKTITVSAPKINNVDNDENITLTGMTPVYGSVTLTLDMSALNSAKSGNFVGTTPTYTITATAL